jgi:thiamine pyrophosphokinase
VQALILANGELYRPEIARNRVAESSFGLVVAADAGARFAKELGVRLDAVVGDFDSLTMSERKALGEVIFITAPAEKDETDLELALIYAQSRGANRMVVLAAAGGRLDMTLANVSLLAHGHFTACRIEFWHGAETVWVIRPPGGEIRGKVGDTLSLMPLGDSALYVTTEGLKYSLSGEDLPQGSVRGLSNVLAAPEASVSFTGGLLLAVHAPAPGTEGDWYGKREKDD